MAYELEYTLLDNDTYEVSGRGTCTDRDLIIPSKYNGKAVTRIGRRAFAGYSSLTSVVIGDSVMSIGEYAFEHCYNLTNVVIGASVTSIGNSAFYECEKLIEIYNKSALSITTNSGSKNGYVGRYAKNIYTPTDGESKLYNDNGYLIYADGEEQILVNYTGNETDLTLPPYIKTICAFAFYTCGRLTNVVIPNTVTSIGRGAFESCDNLKNIVLSNGITSIAASMFAYCYRLTSIVIPDGVTSIGYDAFIQCRNLTSAVIPDSVTSIDDYAFDDCEKLTNLYYKGTPSNWDNIDVGLSENGALFNAIRYYYSETEPTTEGNYWHYNEDNQPTAWPTLTYGSEGLKYTIKDDYTYSVTGIGVCTDTHIIIPQYYNHRAVTSIDSSAFKDCDNILGVTIPATITEIGAGAFHSCSSLAQIELSEGLATIGNSAFKNCTALRDIIIPGSVKTIGSNILEGCRIEKVYFNGTEATWRKININKNNSILTDYTMIYFYSEQSPTYQGNHWHYDENNQPIIWEVVFDNQLKFRLCSNGQGYEVIGVGTYTNAENKLTIPEKYNNRYVVGIGKSAFKDNTTFKGARITKNTRYIDEAAFYGCSGLGEVVLDYSNALTTIGTAAFQYCTGLTTVTIPSTVTSIDADAFRGCSALKSFNSESTKVKTVSEGTFYGCSALEEIVIPKGITTIGVNAFRNCEALTKVTMPDTVKTLDERAFGYCMALESISIPKSVTMINGRAFSGCSALANIDVDTDNTIYQSIDGNVYNKEGTSLIFYAPGKTATSFTTPAGVINVNECAFYNCKNLVKIVISDPVVAIGANAFEGCESLLNVVMGPNVTTLETRTFKDCFSLENVAINNGITCLDTEVFYNCTNLKNVIIPATVTEIGSWLFGECGNLTSVTLLGSTPAELCGDLFKKVPEGVVLYCRTDALENYKTAFVWSQYTDRFIADDLKIYFTMNSIAQKKYFATKSELNTVAAEVKEAVSELNNDITELVNSVTDINDEIQNIKDEKFNTSGGKISGDVMITGNLQVSGKTTTLDTVTLQVQDNVIVANSDGAELVENAGFAVKTKDDTAYGIMYDPTGDGVKIGLGAFDENGKFEYTEGEDQFLATRANAIEDGHIPKWDDETKQFVDSGVGHDEYVKFQDYATNGRAGVVDTRNAFGVNCDQWGRLSVVKAEKATIDAKAHEHQPIVPKMLDYAVKVGLTTNTETLTDEERAKACEWLGAADKKYVEGKVGEIETALDGIIAIQNTIIGGGV